MENFQDLINFAGGIAVNGLNAGDLGAAGVRVAIGGFFAISGYHKLFNATRHAHLAQTMVNDKIPFPKFNEWWVPGWEFLGGLMVAFGLFAPFAAVVLSIICLVACASEAKSKVDSYHPIDTADRIDDYLYLPEVLYLVSLFYVVLAGGGKYRLDALFF
jgi:putative oxidoreductase